MILHTDSKVCLSMIHKNKQVKVTLEFPEQSDQTAMQELISLFKAIYLEKIKVDAAQKEDLTL